MFASAQKRTVPMAKLEQDMAEGRQLADTPRERWRTMEQGKPFYDRKVLIYSMLDAKLPGLDLDTFMSCYNDKAQDTGSRTGDVRLLQDIAKAAGSLEDLSEPVLLRAAAEAIQRYLYVFDLDD